MCIYKQISINVLECIILLFLLLHFCMMCVYEYTHIPLMWIHTCDMHVKVQEHLLGVAQLSYLMLQCFPVCVASLDMGAST